MYAWFLVEPDALAGLPDPGSRPLYIGWARDLAERLHTHLREGGSGSSTLRRSLGALLREELDLSPRPRGRTAEDKNYRCYRFDDEGEQRLSGWMGRNLRVAIAEHAHAEDAESELVTLARPPLNLAGWANPHGPFIRSLCRDCADEARRAFPR